MKRIRPSTTPSAAQRRSLPNVIGGNTYPVGIKERLLNVLGIKVMLCNVVDVVLVPIKQRSASHSRN